MEKMSLNKEKMKMNAAARLKAVCTTYHPRHVQKLHEEVTNFTNLIRKQDGFQEENVFTFGDVHVEPNRLLSNLALIEEGLPYVVDGTVKMFDSAQHLYEFLCHGIPDQVDMWTRGGVMSCFVNVFGEEKGHKMKEGPWQHFIGVIPFILMKPNQAALRASLGLELKRAVSLTQQPTAESVAATSLGSLGTDESVMHKRRESMDQYMLWRPVLLAKFSLPTFKHLLLSTHGKYLLDKEDRSKMSDQSQGGCILYPKPKTKDAGKEAKKRYEDAKKNMQRINGKLQGKNRMGRFLMAIRSELFMMEVVKESQKESGKESGTSGTSDGDKKLEGLKTSSRKRKHGD
jgi:predicted NAD-dependent protein-ADP-ribosyltransferase YbiA (DUF1768 family)